MALAIIDHNLSQNARKLTVPANEWERRCQPMDRLVDDPVDVLLNFLPRKARRISPQGISLHAIDYYEPWLGPPVARRDRLDPLDVRYDPRDISQVYVNDPDAGAWRAVKRRDGLTERVTLWRHEADRLRRREDERRPVQDKTAIRREIAATVAGTKSTKRQLKEMLRARHAAEASKPYESLASSSASIPAKPDPGRSRRIFPVEEW